MNSADIKIGVVVVQTNNDKPKEEKPEGKEK